MAEKNAYHDGKIQMRRMISCVGAGDTEDV